MKLRSSLILSICVCAGLIGRAIATDIVGDHMPGPLDIEGDSSGKILMLGSDLADPPAHGFSIYVGPGIVGDNDGLYYLNRANTSDARWEWRSATGVAAMQLETYIGGGSLWVNGWISAPGVSSSGPIYSYGLPVLTSTANGGFAFGSGAYASASNAAAIGSVTTASAANSAAFGLGTVAANISQFVLGEYNLWVPNSLFVIGNGVSGARANAFTVMRNGDTNILGRLKVGSGLNATGTSSAVIGINSSVSGHYSAVVGESSNAEGDGSFVSGFQSEAGPNADHSVAMGWYSKASGNVSVALGFGTEAKHEGAVALGKYNWADNTVATATGYNTWATGPFSLTTGFETIAGGSVSSAFGYQTYADGNYQMVVGKWNEPQGSWTATLDTDPLFIVGNGTSTDAANRSNAMMVRANGQTVVGKFSKSDSDSTGNHGEGLFIVGNGSSTTRKNALRVRADGTLLITPAGDISMGGFTAGEKP